MVSCHTKGTYQLQPAYMTIFKKRLRACCKSLLPTSPSSAIIDKNNTYGDFLVVSFFQRTVNSKSPVRAFFFRLFSSVRPPHALVR